MQKGHGSERHGTGIVDQVRVPGLAGYERSFDMNHQVRIKDGKT